MPEVAWVARLIEMKGVETVLTLFRLESTSGAQITLPEGERGTPASGERRKGPDRVGISYA